MPDFRFQARLVRAFLLASALLPTAQAQPNAPAAACPKALDVSQPHLLGLWRAEFEGLPQGATLLLEKHPEFQGSFTGGLNRNGQRAQIAADIEKGEFTMEESADGVRVSGSWVGQVVEGSCGREIRGTWQEEKDPPRPYPFVLRKQAAW